MIKKQRAYTKGMMSMKTDKDMVYKLLYQSDSLKCTGFSRKDLMYVIHVINYKGD